MNDNILEAAMLYRSLGLFVIPLAPLSKALGYELAERIGYEPHSTDRPSIADIDHWFAVEPELNIGIRMAGSGLTVVDVDDLKAWGLWAEPFGYGPDTPRVNTYNGMHFFFKASPEDHCGSIYHQEKLIGDFLTPTPPSWRVWDRAYVVAPPSVHPENSDFRYEWIINLWDRPLVAVPDWIRAAVKTPIEPHSWWGDDDEYEDDEERRPDCPYCGGEFWDGGTSCTCGTEYDVNTIVQELLDQRYPDGPPDDLDWGDLYTDAYQLQAERATVGMPCAKCGKPLPPDLLCECETYHEEYDVLPDDE